MVYCGKPSRGCQMCRTRRIKCDETKPTCLQCQKSRRQCPGYKNDFDLVFRNETQATERRARRSMAKGKDKKDKETRATTTSTELIKSPTAAQIAAASHSAPVSVAMEVPVDQQAFCYFLSNYVLIPRTKDTKGFMSYLLPLLQSNDNDSCLSKAVSAVSMAALANRPNSKTLLWKARGLYSQTLLSLNHALRDPVAQLKDETLASVLLMGLFEQMLSMKTNVTAWGSHTEGAVQLVRLRGRKALESPIGRAMFLSVRSSYVVHCFCASKSPEFGIDWWTQLGEGYTDPVYDEIQRLNLHAADVRTQLNTILLTPLRTPENIAKVNAVIQRANALDKEFQEWMQNAPPHWQYKTVAWVENFQGPPEKSEVCPGRVDVYPDVWIASVWNYARVSRLLISGIIIRCVAWMNAPQDYRTTPEYAVSARLGSEIVTDIIASLAFAYGYAKSDATTGGAGFVCGDNTAPHSKSLGAFLNIWPTFSVCNSDYTTDQQRRYCYGRLKYTTHELGVNQAEVLSHFNLRLPSMSIRRDGMALMAAYAAISPEATTHSGSSAAGSPASSTFTRGVSPTSSVSSIGSPTSVSEIDAATREAYEKRFREAVKKTRDEVVKTASNEGGDSSVQTMKNWFGVR